ncbi:Mur ligase family protein [Anaerofustis stercorihominis]|uniref:UDP-N-acetylmuramyl-tripeptide synthetase n=1 Tax=Anaerofustis stercorihominis TaxID=214853 RepID=A0A3E3DXJ7_9FIRM|nr:UDP-N-acetylmuramyl-tripeptide synthetase [Anaerofustis stercorihominis]RGD73806.1 UDP-N-acetylmuramyl-tripeptide synthetase [Anaerofustis stercorihominis]
MNIKVKDIINILNRENQIVDIKVLNQSDIISNVTYNSKAVKDKDVFVCKGLNFKEEYLTDAISRGCGLYISEKIYNYNIPYIIVKDARKSLALISKLFYAEKTEKLKLIGVTGTKGKSTTSFFIKNILDLYLKSKGKMLSGIISTIDTYDGSEISESSLTTPESLEFYKLLNNAVNNELEYFVCEISSIAYKYSRVYGANFNVGVFLNIGYDHISDVEHKDFDDYFSSKIKLLENSEYIVINKDLLRYDEINEVLNNKEKDKIFTFSIDDKADYKAINIKRKNRFTSFDLVHNGETKNYNLLMSGLYNVENAIAAIIVCEILCIDYKYIFKGILGSAVKGRGEIYKTKDGKKTLIVDYAHNELSLKRYFEFIKEEFKDKKHICIIGAPGGKALNRRKEIGTLCYKNCDEIILTSDDPFYESFDNICSEIMSFIPKYKKIRVIENRTEAIKEAVNSYKNEETIISILGKGSETSQNYNGISRDYISDSVNAKIFVEEYNKNINQI